MSHILYLFVYFVNPFNFKGRVPLVYGGSIRLMFPFVYGVVLVCDGFGRAYPCVNFGFKHVPWQIFVSKRGKDCHGLFPVPVIKVYFPHF